MVPLVFVLDMDDVLEDLNQKIIPYHSDSEQTNDFSMKFIVEGIVLMVVGTVGLFGNTMGILFFVKHKNQMTFHRLMILLFVCENIYLLLTILVFSAPQLNEWYRTYCLRYIVPIILPLVQTALTGSVYSTLAISLERFLVVCRPFYTLSQRPLSTKTYIICIIIFSFIFNIPKFFELKTCHNFLEDTRGLDINSLNLERSITSNSMSDLKTETDLNCTKEGYKATNLRLNSVYYSIYLFWMNLVFMGIIPYVTLVVLNSRILNNLRLHLQHRNQCSVLESRPPNSGDTTFHECCIPFTKTKKNQILLAKTNLVIVLTFILCHSLRWIPNIYEFIYKEMYDESSWVQSVECISHLLITLSSSVNSYIYRFTHFNVFSKIKRSIRKNAKTKHSSYKKKRLKHEDNNCEEIELPMFNVDNQK